MAARGKSVVLAVALLTSVLGACGSGGGNARIVQVDYHSDDFAGTFRGYFPTNVTVRPGMTVRFHQTWSGEPHTVTTGTEVQRRLTPFLPLIKSHPTTEVPQDVASAGDLKPAFDALNDLPFFFGQTSVNQAAAQPCYLDKGLPDGENACAKRVQPAFNGKQSYYSSGFIPYLGVQGNEYAIKIAPDTKPGTYYYYCTLHGPDMTGSITVTKGSAIPSQSEVNRQAAQQAAKFSGPLLAQLRKEQAGKSDFKTNLAGSGTDSLLGFKGQVNEFTPRTVKTKVGEPVTWTFIGTHTISFNVPKYVPYYTVKPSGDVVQSQTIDAPAGGWPGRSVPLPEDDNAPPLPVEHVDAGKFAGGTGLKSSGDGYETGDSYSVTFTKPGTYPMACLIHPGMIGKVVVS